MAQVTDVIGVNSILPDGKHILMWDFDDAPLPYVESALETAIAYYMLPNIYILNTGKPNHYIAYCFKRHEWRHAFGIVASTPFVDWNFIKYAAVRGHFTLRVSPKNGKKIRLVKVLKGITKEDACVDELRSWVNYETLPRDEHKKALRIIITRS